ncbi:MAG TPA: Rossmann fold nucleotide-binding protein [Nocardioides sp.]|nr:Rossmann fold nucleotide-binding protein [Nocardioides sp.]
MSRRRSIRADEVALLATLPEPEASAPVDPERTSLYTADELYDRPRYRDTLDARAYAWSRKPHDRASARVRALHDFSIDEALDSWIAERRIAGIMGGHEAVRGDQNYARTAHLAHRLSARLTIATGGGPGAMEAGNLGASYGNQAGEDLERTIDELGRVPTYTPSISDWAASALAARAADPRDNLGIPTWHYGEEPPNVFATSIAKYFKNAQREAILLNICNAGIVFLPGAAGTVQEIFQDACENFYALPERVAPMILLGAEYWTRTLPVWPLLSSLSTLDVSGVGGTRPMAAQIHLANSIDEVVELLS